MRNEQQVEKAGALIRLQERVAQMASDLEYLENEINRKLQKIESYSELPSEDKYAQSIGQPIKGGLEDGIISSIHAGVTRIKDVKERLEFASRHLDEIV